MTSDTFEESGTDGPSGTEPKGSKACGENIRLADTGADLDETGRNLREEESPGFIRGEEVKLYTIGHGYQSAEEFVEKLHRHDIDLLVDVRSFPGSRRSPQFNSDAMSGWLRDAGIDYVLEKRLGGRRKAPKNPVPHDSWWTVESFGFYGGHMRTEEWRDAYAWLHGEFEQRDVAIMCGEPHHSRCHRRMISDFATVNGHVVGHIESSGKLTIHQASEWAQGLALVDAGQESSR